MTAPKSVFNRSGSHAGRGFRYQDAVGAWLAVRAWAEPLAYGEVVPEGLDDFELRGAHALTLVQAKSRRDGLGAFPAADVADYIAALWRRHDAAPQRPCTLLLVLERAVAGWILDANDGLGGRPPIEALDFPVLRAHPARLDLIAKTRILVLDAPMEATVEYLGRRTVGPPLLGQIYYGEIVRHIGELSDANGVASTFSGLTITDLDQLVENLRSVVALEGLAPAIAEGLCETIDFLTPLPDPMFYLGVDVRPGHLAAGLVAERPASRARLLAALEAQRAALVVGPSGAGKSALMWEAARASRHVIRWFKIGRLREEDVPALVRFARAMRATSAAPVGFIFDDVGRGRAAGWNALLDQAVGGAGLVMLGSIREEDTLLLDNRSAAAEVREVGDEELAERLWRELRERDQTSWAGWREPWNQAKGLLLEYAALLSQGERLGKILADQVDRRRREKRFEELQVLRLVALAGAVGATVDATRLPDALNLSADEVSNALSRLIDEHLIRDEGGERVSGLHQLRSTELCRLTHMAPPPTLAQSAQRVACVVPVADLELFVSRLLVADPKLEAAVLAGLVERLTAERDAGVLAASLDGLGQAHVVRTIAAWLPEAERRGIAPTQITATVMFALARSSFEALERLQPAIEAGKLLNLSAEADLRHALIVKLPDTVLDNLVSKAGPAELEALLSAMVGAAPSPAILQALEAKAVDLMSIDMRVAVRLAATTGLIAPDCVARWVEKADQVALLNRLQASTPWAGPITLSAEGDETIVAGDIRFVSSTFQTNLNDEVVAHCEAMLALAPSATLAASDAVGVDGQLAGIEEFPLASKRIPRANLSAAALPRWNRRWMKAAAYAVGQDSYTAFLEEARRILEVLVPRLERVFEQLLLGKINDVLLEEIGQAHEATRRLTPPREKLSGVVGAESGGEIHSTSVQAALFAASADLIRFFGDLPADAAVFLLKVKDLREHIAKARAEPWSLIEKPPVAMFDRLAHLTEALWLLGGEAMARGSNPVTLWHGRAKSARRGNALRLVAFEVTRAVEQRLDEVRKALKAALIEIEVDAEIIVRQDKANVRPWPTCKVLAIIPLESLRDWEPVVERAWPALRQAAGEGRGLWLVPSIGGLVVSRLSVGGVGRPFPIPYDVDIWLADEGKTLLDDVCTRIWSQALDALIEIDGVRHLGFATPTRPAREADVVEDARRRKAQAYAALGPRLQASPDMYDQLVEFAEQVERGEIELAAGTSRILRGQAPELLNLLTGAHRITLACDLLEILDPPDAPQEAL